ncbi:MAG: WYL domain-containing protein [Rubrivivax sp.]
MAAAQLKLLAALPAEGRADADRMARCFHLDPVDWFRSAVPPALLPAIADAIWQHRRLAMRYESWQRTSDRSVEPLGLVLKAGTWYLVARTVSHAEPAVFRVAAIESLSTLDEAFVPPPGFELAAFWRASAARFEAGVYTATARLRLNEAGFRRLCQFSPAVERAALDSAMPSDTAGSVEVEVPIESVQHAARELLRLGDDAEVLAPAALREGLHATAQRMCERYA